MRVLVVEDEPRIAEDLRIMLVQAGYAVDVVGDGEAAWFQAAVEKYGAVILDLGLPRMDGLSVLRRLRADGHAVPVLILTARDGWRERVEGIDAGADDYLPKPFRMEELLARLRSIVRRSAGHASPILRVGSVELDTRDRCVTVGGRSVNLTALEYRALSSLMHSSGRVVSPTELLEHLYDSDTERDLNAMEAVVARLRKKLDVPLIETRRGQGYIVSIVKP